MTEQLEPAQRLIQEPDEARRGWTAREVSGDELVDDDWIRENTKEVTDDGVDESDSSESS